MEKARNAAWAFAEQISPLRGDTRAQAIAEKDCKFAVFSNVIMHPGVFLASVLLIVRLGERGTTRSRIEMLE